MLGEVETMSFKLKANPIGLRGAFLTCLSRVSNAWGRVEILAINLYSGSKKLRSQNLKLEICRELPSARAGDPTLIKTLARS